MTMKICELCKGLARMHCESDRASLCWSCDYKVHSANFLVARHSRTLLCQVCQAPTPWTATGSKLGPTVSVCDRCVKNYNKINSNEESEARYEDEEIESDNFDEDDEEDDEDDEESDCEEDTDSEDNQVVPWSPSTPPPPSTANSPSNSDEESYSSSSMSSPCNQRGAQRKRTREDTDRCFNVNCVSTPSQGNADTPPLATTTVAVLKAAVKDDSSGEDKGTVESVDSLSTTAEESLKKRRINTGQSRISGSRSWIIVESIKRLHQEKLISGEGIAELRRLSEDLSAVDCDSSDST